MPTDFREKVNKLVEPVRDMLLSNLPAKANYKAATSYGLNDQQLQEIAKLMGLIFVAEINLSDFAQAIKDHADVPPPVACGLAAQITKEIFLPLKEFFSDAPALVSSWSQKATPPTHEPKTLEIEEEEKGAPKEEKIAEEIIFQSLEETLAAGRKECLLQKIGDTLLKISDSPEPLQPFVKNWLLDYKQYKGQFPDGDLPLVRLGYLYKSDNGRNLTYNQREALNALLKAYDDKTKLPFSKKSGLILFEKLISRANQTPAPKPISATPAAPPKNIQPPANIPTPPLPLQNKPNYARIVPPSLSPKPQPALPPQPPPPVAPARPAARPQNNPYREQVNFEDLAGPQPPRKPEPKLEGNVVDLKGFRGEL
ncbi:MAG: hypothetical protein V1684_02455 [bacterium]